MIPAYTVAALVNLWVLAIHIHLKEIVRECDGVLFVNNINLSVYLITVTVVSFWAQRRQGASVRIVGYRLNSFIIYEVCGQSSSIINQFYEAQNLLSMSPL